MALGSGISCKVTSFTVFSFQDNSYAELKLLCACCMSTRHSSGNDLGKDSCDVLRRYDNVCVTEIKQIFCVCLSYYSFYISTVCWSSNTKCLFTQKLYVTLHPCPIFLPCDMFFPSCSRSSCWVFSFHPHI